MLSSDWYKERLKVKQARDIRLWEGHVKALESFSQKTTHSQESTRLGIPDRLTKAKDTLEEIRSATYLEKLNGTLGVQPGL